MAPSRLWTILHWSIIAWDCLDKLVIYIGTRSKTRNIKQTFDNIHQEQVTCNRVSFPKTEFLIKKIKKGKGGPDKSHRQTSIIYILSSMNSETGAHAYEAP